MNPHPITLYRSVELFTIFKKAERLRPNTIRWYNDMLKPFLDHIGADTAVETIQPSTIAGFMAAQEEKGMTPHTIDARYRALSAFFNWLETCDEAGNPTSPIGRGRTKKIRRPKLPLRAPRTTTYEEFLKLLSTIPHDTWVNARDRAIIRLLFTTAIRRAELLLMNVQDIDFQTEFTMVVGKYDMQRPIPLEATTLSSISNYLALRPEYDGRAIWLQKAPGFKVKGRLGETGLRLMLQRRCEQAGIRFLNPHSFRHGGATYMLNKGADISFVQNLLGHSTPSITEKIYARWLPHGLKAHHNQIWSECSNAL